MQLFLKVLCILLMQRKAHHTICAQLQTKDKSYMLNRLLVQRELGVCSLLLFKPLINESEQKEIFILES